MSPDWSRLRQKLHDLEAGRPSFEDDPHGYQRTSNEIRRVTEEMARLSDRSRMYQDATGWKVA